MRKLTIPGKSAYLGSAISCDFLRNSEIIRSITVVRALVRRP